MKKVLQEKLFTSYPNIFKQKDATAQESCMSRGICCGDGWFDLIDTLCLRIQSRVSAVKRNIDAESARRGVTLIPAKLGYLKCEAVQVKEKFGGLRFYIVGGDDYINGLVDFAESMSHKMCSECGRKSVSQVKRGWIYTLCGTCRDISRDSRKNTSKQTLNSTSSL